MEDLEQIFLRSWRESHLTEIRQYQQVPPQPFPPATSTAAPVTSAQLPWLAGLAASSCNDSVHVIECAYSLAEGLSEMFRLLIEGKLSKTNYVVIICACRNAAIDSCIAVTGESWPPLGQWESRTIDCPVSLKSGSPSFVLGFWVTEAVSSLVHAGVRRRQPWSQLLIPGNMLSYRQSCHQWLC